MRDLQSTILQLWLTKGQRNLSSVHIDLGGLHNFFPKPRLLAGIAIDDGFLCGVKQTAGNRCKMVRFHFAFVCHPRNSSATAAKAQLPRPDVTHAMHKGSLRSVDELVLSMSLHEHFACQYVQAHPARID